MDRSFRKGKSLHHASDCINRKYLKRETFQYSDVFRSCYSSRRGSDLPTPFRIMRSHTRPAGNRWQFFVAFWVWKINEGSRVWEASSRSHSILPAFHRKYRLKLNGRAVQSDWAASSMSYCEHWWRHQGTRSTSEAELKQSAHCCACCHLHLHQIRIKLIHHHFCSETDSAKSPVWVTFWVGGSPEATVLVLAYYGILPVLLMVSH